MLWPVEFLNRDAFIKSQWTSGEQIYSKLDDVQAFAVALSEGEMLSWTKSTHFLQELEVHPARHKFNRKRILTVLCDEYLSAIVIPTLQSWMEMFDRIDWNRSRAVGFLELKQGLSACSSPEGKLPTAPALVSKCNTSVCWRNSWTTAFYPRCIDCCEWCSRAYSKRQALPHCYKPL
jgi:hypothetical protein